MFAFLLKWIINTIALCGVIVMIPGIRAERWETVLVAALILGLLNALIKPLINYFTLSLQILSLGFFTLIINGFIFYLIPQFVIGFYVDNFWSAFWGAILFSIISFLLNLFIVPRQNSNFVYRQKASPRYRNDSVIDVEGKVKED